MDKKELQMLAILRNNARMKLTSISRRTQMPVSTLYDRLKGLEAGIIKKHSALLDFNALGYVVRVHLLLSVDKSHKQDLIETLTKSNCINSLYKVNNGFDIVAEALFKDINELETFTDSLSKHKVKDKKILYIVDELRREAFLSDVSII